MFDKVPDSVQIIRDSDQWDNLANDWNVLAASSDRAAAPLEFAWLRRWWQEYGQTYGIQGTGLRIISVWRDGQLSGVLPLYESRVGGSALGVRRLQFLSTGEAECEETCPDYMNALCRVGEEAECLRAFWATLRQIPWEYLDLLDVPSGVPLLDKQNLPDWVSQWEVSARGTCPIANLDGGFDAYLQRLSANTRQQARRQLREAEKEGVKFELASETNMEQMFDELVQLHQSRWAAEGKPGCFAAQRFTSFHRSLAREWVPSGRAVLARLSLADEPVAVLYGFVNRSKFEFYQSGIKTTASGRLRSPGNLAHLKLMSRMSDGGVDTYDFLRGSSSYKERLATTSIPLYRVRVWRSTVRAGVHRSIIALKDKTRSMARKMLRRDGVGKIEDDHEA
jgi:CelD/BcsL family acetyltransferase involved in cellulose biosynthesis